jgi:hypothetical protein
VAAAFIPSAASATFSLRRQGRLPFAASTRRRIKPSEDWMYSRNGPRMVSHTLAASAPMYVCNNTELERKLDAFPTTSARDGLAERTIADYIGTIRRLYPTIGLNPPHHALGGSWSHRNCSGSV